MKYFVLLGIVSAILGMIGISSADARDAVVVVKAAGEAYDGPPKLRLLADGHLIGERTLGKSIDTANGQRLTIANRSKHLEWLQFKVPAIEGIKKIEIEFNNDASAGKGKSGGDRNFYVYGLFIDGYPFRWKDLIPVPADSGGTWSAEAMLWSNGRLQLNRPAKGWRSGYKAATPSH
jgi:hypothetical protein